MRDCPSDIRTTPRHRCGFNDNIIPNRQQSVTHDSDMRDHVGMTSVPFNESQHFGPVVLIEHAPMSESGRFHGKRFEFPLHSQASSPACSEKSGGGPLLMSQE